VYVRRANGCWTVRVTASTTPFSMRSSKKAKSSVVRAIVASVTSRMNSSASASRSSRSANAISGSTIQNSAAWRAVFEFSARNAGPNV
jgi:hypothetical protein